MNNYYQPHQVMFMLLHSTGIIFLSMLCTQKGWNIGMFGIVYFLFSIATMTRYFKMRNRGFKFYTQADFSKVHHLEANEKVSLGRFIYFKRGMAQGIEVFVEIKEDRIDLEFSYYFESTYRNKNTVKHLEKRIEKAVLKNLNIRLQVLFEKIKIKTTFNN
jgi:dolichol kinase